MIDTATIAAGTEPVNSVHKALGFAAIALMAALVSVRGDEQSENRLLDFTVVAVDDRGQPVNDLKSGDFQVTDAGKRREIAFFRHNDEKLRQTQALGPNEFSNRSGVPAPHITLVLLDLLNENFATRGVSANQLSHDLERLESADGLYLYLLTVDGRTFAVHGLTSPEGETRETNDVPWTRGVKPLLDGAMRDVLRIKPVDISADVNVRVRVTLNALDAVAQQLSMFPGRKNVVWVTDGVPLELGPHRSDTGQYVDFTPQLRQLAEVFDRYETAIYPVQQNMLGKIESRATLEEIAGLTGGRPSGGKDIAAAVRQAVTDVRTSYQLGYYADPGNWDGKFHKLRITCTRKGVRIQARSGYYAIQEPAEARSQRAIEEAAGSGFDAAEIGIRGTLTPEPRDSRHMHLAGRIDTNDVVLVQDGDRYSGQLRVAVVPYRSDGRIAGSTITAIDLHFSPAELDTSYKEGMAFEQELTLEDDVSKLRVVVFDRDSNTVGSLTIPVAVSSPRK
jgi:VWFA-related protein